MRCVTQYFQVGFWRSSAIFPSAPQQIRGFVKLNPRYRFSTTHWLLLHNKKAARELNLRPIALYPAVFPRFPRPVCGLHPGIFILRWLSHSAHMLLFHLVRGSADQPLRLVTDKWAILVNQYCLWVFCFVFFCYQIQMLPLNFRRMLVGASSAQIKSLFVSRLGHVGRENICNALINSICCGFKHSNAHCLCLLTHNPPPNTYTPFMMASVYRVLNSGWAKSKKKRKKKKSKTHPLLFWNMCKPVCSSIGSAIPAPKRLQSSDYTLCTTRHK